MVCLKALSIHAIPDFMKGSLGFNGPTDASTPETPRRPLLLDTSTEVRWSAEALVALRALIRTKNHIEAPSPTDAHLYTRGTCDKISCVSNIATVERGLTSQRKNVRDVSGQDDDHCCWPKASLLY